MKFVLKYCKWQIVQDFALVVTAGALHFEEWNIILLAADQEKSLTMYSCNTK